MSSNFAFQDNFNVKKIDANLKNVLQFLDTQVSLAPTHESKLVRKLVGP